MKDAVLSIEHVPIRLTDERWVHITEEHCELAGLRIEVLETVANPEIILTGGTGELLAVRKFNIGKYLAVVYREFIDDCLSVIFSEASPIISIFRNKARFNVSLCMNYFSLNPRFVLKTTFNP